VNDRGPLVHSRIVDVSYAAARKLGFRGMTRVRMELIDPSPSAAEIARLSWPQNSKN
jgi:rare lipoprotein A